MMHLPHVLALEHGQKRLSRKIGSTGVSERLSVPDRHEIVPMLPENGGPSLRVS